MKILMVGSGGREHALIRKLKESGRVTEVICAPGNAGISRDAECFPVAAADIQGIVALATEQKADIVFVAPDDPLAAGMVDALEEAGIKAYGPKAAAAEIESSKVFSKGLMKKYGIPTAAYEVFEDPRTALLFIKSKNSYPVVVKADGLALGKGVIIAQDYEGAEKAVISIMQDKVFGASGNKVVIEEFLTGPEVSVLSFTDGETILPMVSSMDHKKAFDGDSGPNTGGMGSYTLPEHKLPFVTDEDYNKAFSIMKRTVASLVSEGTPFVGILYGQFMNTANGPMVIEFNARFGDPEAMNVLSLLTSDFTTLVQAITEGTLDKTEVHFAKKASVCKYLVPEGYPNAPISGGKLIIEPDNKALCYYASVVRDGEYLVTQSSRTMAYVGIGDTLDEAERIAEEAASAVVGPVRHRKDIGTRAVLDKRITHMKEIR